MPDFAPYLAAAEQAARKAGAFLREQFYTVKQVDESLQHDIKLRLDKESQELITAALLASFPHSAILGEEGSSGEAAADFLWVVDPIDGTVNYFYNIPIFCVSIALQYRGQMVLGCVYDPMQNEWAASQRVVSQSHGRGCFIHRSWHARWLGRGRYPPFCPYFPPGAQNPYSRFGCTHALLHCRGAL